MSFLLIEAKKLLLETKWMNLPHPIKQGDRVKINGTETPGTVVDDLPDGDELRVALDSGAVVQIRRIQLTKIAT
jgi:hypothetical protein